MELLFKPGHNRIVAEAGGSPPPRGTPVPPSRVEEAKSLLELRGARRKLAVDMMPKARSESGGELGLIIGRHCR